MELIGWKQLSGGYGNAGMRPERRLSGRNRSGQRELLPSFLDSGAKAINPRVLGTESPFQKRSLPFIEPGEWSTTKALTFLEYGISLQGVHFND
jgi:hypothetical protein